MGRGTTDPPPPKPSVELPLPLPQALEAACEGRSCHGTVVAVNGRALLILGPSGAGKSALGVEMIALGADLVADDRVLLSPRGDSVWASAPRPTRGLIEARGLGLIALPPLDEAPLAAVLDLTIREDARLPPWRHISLFGCQIPLIYRPMAEHAAPALLLYLSHGRHA